LAAVRFDAHGQATGQGEEFTAGRQFDQVFRFGPEKTTGGAAGHLQSAVVENLAAAVGKE
jgi:hypothetical protein